MQYCGTNGDADVIGLPGVHIECKRVERLNVHEAMIQSLHDARAEELSTVMSRRDNSPWLVTMTLEDWMILYQAWEIERSNAHESNNRLQGDKKDRQLVKKVCILRDIQNGKPQVCRAIKGVFASKSNKGGGQRMTKSEAREWFKNRMDSGLMPGTREAYKAALSALTVEHNSPTMKQAKKAWQGHWVDCRDDREFCQCSECNYPVFKNWNKGDFCPNCGTPMTDKALRELLKRLEMLKDDKTDTPPPNESLTLISMEDDLPPDNERVLVYRPCMADADIGPYSVQWGWAAKKDGSYWAYLPSRAERKQNEENRN